LLLLSQLC